MKGEHGQDEELACISIRQMLGDPFGVSMVERDGTKSEVAWRLGKTDQVSGKQVPSSAICGLWRRAKTALIPSASKA